MVSCLNNNLAVLLILSLLCCDGFQRTKPSVQLHFYKLLLQDTNPHVNSVALNYRLNISNIYTSAQSWILVSIHEIAHGVTQSTPSPATVRAASTSASTTPIDTLQNVTGRGEHVLLQVLKALRKQQCVVNRSLHSCIETSRINGLHTLKPSQFKQHKLNNLYTLTFASLCASASTSTGPKRTMLLVASMRARMSPSRII
jgi:hypothetical protein